MSHKYELAPILAGVVTSTFYTELSEKIIMTSVSLVIATTIAFFWRRFLHKYFKNVMRNKNGSNIDKKNTNTTSEN